MNSETAPTGPATPGPISSPRSQAGTLVGGRYLLEELAGEGGMGRVWRAEQVEPVRRTVAVKFIKGGDAEPMLRRFAAERQSLAAMDHPGIAKVFDAGEQDGDPFLVMEFVAGAPLTQYAAANKLGPRETVGLFAAVCAAIQHAHQKGVIHRDIKPSNVLAAEIDGRPAPKVIDFGVAKALGQGAADSMFGFVGTPEYMSPEQAGGTDVDTRADVYSLGVLLYELLTGGPPFPRRDSSAAGLIDLMRRVREADPPRPDPKKVPRDLWWICQKAMAKDRERRYESAAALGRDCERHLAGDPVHAAPPSRRYRLGKFVRRNRAGVLAASAVFASLLLGVAGTAWGLVEARRGREAAETRLRQATDASWKSINTVAGYGWHEVPAKQRLRLNGDLLAALDELAAGRAEEPEAERARLLVLLNLFDAHLDLGEVGAARGRWDAVEPLIARVEASGDPWGRRVVLMSRDRRGNLHVMEGDLPAARRAHGEFARLSAEARGTHFHGEEAALYEAAGSRNLAELELNFERDAEAALPHLERAAGILRSVPPDKLPALEADRLAWLENNTRFAREAIPAAIARPETIPADGNDAAMLWTFRGHYYARHGKPDEAREAARRLGGLTFLPAMCRFEAGRILAIVAGSDPKVAPDAVGELRAARLAGFTSWMRLRNDPAFASLRGRADLDELVEAIKAPGAKK